MIRHAKNLKPSNMEEITEPVSQPDLTFPLTDLPDRSSQNRIRQKKFHALTTGMVLVFFAVLLACAVLLLVLPAFSSLKEADASEPSWPILSFDEYFSGDYAKEIAGYYTARTASLKGFETAGITAGSLLGMDALPVEEAGEASGRIRRSASQDGSADQAEDSYLDVVKSKNYHVENRTAYMQNGFLMVQQDNHWRAFSLYTAEDPSLYAETINYIRQMVNTDVNIFVMPIPLASQFYTPSNYESQNTDMKDTFRSLSIKLISRVKDIDLIDTLNNHNAETIYLRTDSHWTSLAAYYAARDFTRIAGVPFAGMEAYRRKVRADYTGSMYALTGDTKLLDDAENFVYYIPSNGYTVDYYDRNFQYLFTDGLYFNTSVSDSYNVLFGKDDQIIRITTDVDNHRKLLLVKDSFGNALVPFLTSSYEEIYVVDLRYFELNLINFINELQITDLLFAQSYGTLSDTNAELLEYITYSNLEAAVLDQAPPAHPAAGENPDLEEDSGNYPEIQEIKSPEIPTEETVDSGWNYDPPAQDYESWDNTGWEDMDWQDAGWEDIDWEDAAGDGTDWDPAAEEDISEDTPGWEETDWQDAGWEDTGWENPAGDGMDWEDPAGEDAGWYSEDSDYEDNSYYEDE
ncbi:MAG: hypothetical protein IJ106_05920 [Parasporobacterium sp.]|nr:hypothetical protein [Parasporobacterium sp.]